ncbi:hypothetical protein [Dokdonia sp. Hel_I_53]|nr:hypothetical protein [Dokdonia sp. Hel_I_53]TVZ51661.1 hypothetical protein OD90_0809 [Dokdonia sp. Hel_I_53]
MTKRFLTLAVITLFTLSFASCREESTGEKMEDAVEDVADDVEDAVD